jgi:rSAM/selenodomain-associated transferase 2
VRQEMYEKTPYRPELSVIVPLYNESGTVETLFRTLAEQLEVRFELIVCDGGSTDASVTTVRSLAASAPFPVTLAACEKGRGLQLNAGAAASRGATLLFLHADSLFADRHALRNGLDALAAAISASGNDRLAGHFTLRFARSSATPSWGYHFYECKARLHRSGCIHGDQGLLLRRTFFNAVGPFDASLPILEDTRLAETISRKGKWLLLPAEILTSARRFELEGMAERQTLNAIIFNFAAIGRDDFLREIPQLYDCQDRSRSLRLAPFFRRFRQLIRALPRRERLGLWYSTGAYVRDNAWQLAFALDARRSFRRGTPPIEGSAAFLACYDRYLDRLTDHAPGRLAAALLVRLWFELTCLVASLRDKPHQN